MCVLLLKKVTQYCKHAEALKARIEEERRSTSPSPPGPLVPPAPPTQPGQPAPPAQPGPPAQSREPPAPAAAAGQGSAPAPQTSGPAHASAADLGAQPKEPVRDALAAPQDEEEAAEEAWPDASDEVDYGDAEDQDYPPQDAQDVPPRDDQDDPAQGQGRERFRRRGLPCRGLVNRQGDMLVLSSSLFVNNIVSHILDTRRPFLWSEGLHDETDRLTKDSQMQMKAILCRKSRVCNLFKVVYA